VATDVGDWGLEEFVGEGKLIGNSRKINVKRVAKSVEGEILGGGRRGGRTKIQSQSPTRTKKKVTRDITRLT